MLQDIAQRALNRDPERPAIEFDGRWIAWGEIRRLADQLQRILAGSGAPPDAPVAFAPRNRPSSVAALLSLIAQGRTIRMIYSFQAPAVIARDIRQAAPAAFVGDAEDCRDEVLSALKDEGAASVALGGMNAKPLAGLERAGPEAAARRGPEEPCIEILTSGTTGPPKRFPLPCDMIAKHHVGAALDEAPAAQAPPFLLYFPLGNITGVYSTLPTLLKGQRVSLLEKFSLGAWRDYIVRWRPSHTGLPPSFVQAVLDSDIPISDLSCLKSLGTGAAPLDPNVQKAFEERYGVPILLSYGATEFAGPVAAMTLPLHAEWGARKLGSVGRALPGVQLRVIDPDTEEALPPEREGLLEVVSPRIGPGWIRTTDCARIDADGFLYILGRADGAIMRGGFKILPETIERALMTHPAVAEAAVIGIDDRRLGQVPAAALRLKPDAGALDAAALERHLRVHAPAPHIPVKWLFCLDFPRTASLKIDRAALRRLITEG